jgi:DNA-binding CsgD family transcriptional regulator
MNDINSAPEGRQSLAARIIRTILVYALEMPQATAGSGFSEQTLVHEKALIFNYGLSRQEASLAVRLVRGRSLEEAAAELCMSSELARMHFKRIFMKAELHSYLECATRRGFPTGNPPDSNQIKEQGTGN